MARPFSMWGWGEGKRVYCARNFLCLSRVLSPMDLAQLQRAFQQHVLTGDEAISRRVSASQAVPARDRLQVYAQAYQLRLVEALGHNYPRLLQLLGNDQFATLAREYLADYPSSSPSVRWFGNRLHEFLARKYSHTPALRDLASFEWSIANAFDAPDVTALSTDRLATLAPDEWPSLRFVLHPSVQLITTASNAVCVFKSLADEEAVPAPTDESPATWLVWRSELTPRYRSLADDEAAALRAARQERTFEEICDCLSHWHEENSAAVRAITLLKTWIADDLLTDLIIRAR